MKAISLWQPWASLVALKLKTIETRGHDRFKGLVGQRIAIHAGRKFDMEGLLVSRLIDSGKFGHGLSALLAFENITRWALLTRGKILCTARVEQAAWAWDLSNSGVELEGRTLCDVQDKFLIFLEDIETLPEPRWFKGRQGIFNVPEELILSASASLREKNRTISRRGAETLRNDNT